MSKFFNQLKNYKGFQRRYVAFGKTSNDNYDTFVEISGRCHLRRFEAWDEARLALKHNLYKEVCVIEIDDK